MAFVADPGGNLVQLLSGLTHASRAGPGRSGGMGDWCGVNPSGRDMQMPKASKQTASESVALEGYEGHFEHFDGGYTVGFETYSADADLAPLFKGLPDDRCQAPHWGYVVKGKLKFTFADGHDETYEAGDAYYAPPGHLPHLFAGSEVVEFSPSAELAATMEVVEKNMEAA